MVSTNVFHMTLSVECDVLALLKTRQIDNYCFVQNVFTHEIKQSAQGLLGDKYRLYSRVFFLNPRTGKLKYSAQCKSNENLGRRIVVTSPGVRAYYSTSVVVKMSFCTA